MDRYEDPDDLFSLDVVTKTGSGSCIVGTKMTKEWGVVQYRELSEQYCPLIFWNYFSQSPDSF